MDIERIESLTFELKETTAILAYFAEGNEYAEELYSLQKHLNRIYADLVNEIEAAELRSAEAAA